MMHEKKCLWNHAPGMFDKFSWSYLCHTLAEISDDRPRIQQKSSIGFASPPTTSRLEFTCKFFFLSIYLIGSIFKTI